jgi:Mg/Co/Ni transporter MgtE
MYKMENEFNELQKNVETRVAAFLTEEQRKTFRQIQEELPRHIGRPMRRHGPPEFDGPFGPDKE